MNIQLCKVCQTTMQTIELYKEIFQNNEIRIYGTREQPLFVANDIGALLGIKNIHMSLKLFDEYEKSLLSLTYGTSGAKQTVVLTTAGLYRVLYASKKIIAAEFRKWVAKVLDTIRLTGQYDLTEEIEKERTEKQQLENAKLEIEQQLERMQEQASQLEESIAEKDDEIITLRNENNKLSQTYKPIITYHECDINDFIDQPCVYLLHLTANDYKFGKTGDIIARKQQHTRDFKKYNIVPQIVKIWKCNTMSIMESTEKKIKHFAQMNNIQVSKYDKTEIITTDDIATIISRIDHYIEKQNAESSLTEAERIAAEIQRMKLTIAIAEVELPREKIASEIRLAEIELERERIAFEREKFAAERMLAVPKSQTQIALEWITANNPTNGEIVSEYFAKYNAVHHNGLNKSQFTKLTKANGHSVKRLTGKTRWHV